MLSALKKALGIRKQYKKFTKASLFSGSAYFSSRVPNALRGKWAAHGGEVSTGMILDPRARYFFAMDPSDPWAIKLFAKSVMVIHAGWIAHCTDEAFQVPIAEYVLDDSFIPGYPYKLIVNATGISCASPSEPCEPIDTRSGGQGQGLIRTSDTTPSTPTSMPRKRNRELAYFDSPSGSIIYSGFDKDGLPRRPRKQRKLRFDRSFSPEGGKTGREAMHTRGLRWLWDHHDASDDKFSEEHGPHGNARIPLLSHMVAISAPGTPDKPITYEALTGSHRCFAVRDRLLEPTRSPAPAISPDIQRKTSPVRTIDFTNPLPPSRRLLEATSRSRGTDTVLSVARHTDHKVKTPKKISFADHARVCVYPASPQGSDTQDSTSTDIVQLRMDEGSEEGKGKARPSSDDVEDHTNSTRKAVKDFIPQTGFMENNENLAWHLDGDRFENDTLTWTMKDVEAMRRHLLRSAAANGVGDGQLATPFEIGKTFRGMAFRHVW